MDATSAGPPMLPAAQKKLGVTSENNGGAFRTTGRPHCSPPSSSQIQGESEFEVFEVLFVCLFYSKVRLKQVGEKGTGCFKDMLQLRGCLHSFHIE